MQRIPLRLAQAGMVLEKPILRDNGLVLIAEGSELSDTVLRRLESMNVETIVVKGNPVDMEGMGGGTSFSQRAERMDHLFRKYKADPFMLRLKDRLKEYFNLKAAAQAAQEAEEAAARLAQEEADSQDNE